MTNSAASKMLEVMDLAREIQHTSMELLDGIQFFGAMPSLPTPKFTHPELDMLRSLSWLYVLYQELGKASIKYTVEKFESYSLDNNIKNHPLNVEKLRTFSQHSLDPMSQRDREIRVYCEQWFDKYCGVVQPRDDEAWNKALLAILTEAENFLKNIQHCIRKIESDESKEQLIIQWKYRLQRYHPQHEFDRIISIVAHDLGRVGIEPKNFSNQYYSQWKKELELMEDYDFEKEARRMIERAMIENTRPRLPINGTDIMDEFLLEPGKKIGEILKRAFEIFDPDPCSREVLISKLRDEFK